MMNCDKLPVDEASARVREEFRSMDVALRPWIVGQADSVLRSIMGSVEYGVLLTDLEHTSLACNVRFGEMFGIDIDAVVKSDAEEVRDMVNLRIVDIEAWRKNLSEVYSDLERVQADLMELKNPAQTLERYTCPVRDETGAVTARLWTFRDVTQQRRSMLMQDLLHELSTLFDPDPERVYDQIVQRIGEFYGSVSVLSLRRNDYMQFLAVGGPMPEARTLPGNDLAQSYCQFCLEVDGPMIIQDAKLDERYGQVLPATLGLTRYAGVPLRSSAGAIVGTLCVLDDRSHELHGPEDLRFLSLMAMRISSELEREAQLKVLESDLAIAQAKLIQNEKLAVTGTLAASIAHDIRNIVSALTLDLSLAPTDEASKQNWSNHLNRFNVLSHRLLSYAKPERMHLQSVDLADLLGKVEALLAPHFHVASIQYDCEFPPDLPTVQGDPGRLEHLFINLILNAIQAMKHEGRVHVSANQEGEMVEVRLRDTGPGIGPAELERLFEPFVSSRNDGFGLGLYSCQQIAKECGGAIYAESELGQGTTFVIRLVVA